MLIYTILIKHNKGRDVKMDGYHKIAVKNVCVVDVCFRRLGLLYNDGRIIVDIDTYDFAGHITDDVIVGFYRNGKYYIHYYYKTYIFDVNPVTGMIEGEGYQWEEYEIQLTVDFKKRTPKEDFVNNMLEFGDDSDSYVLTFETIISEIQEIQNTLNNNIDLLTPRT